LRFISPHRGYEQALRNPKIQSFTQSGDPIYDGSYLKAEFVGGGVSPWEAEEALKTFSFKGAYEGEDLTERLSWFDTELAQMHYGWTDDERELAEKVLLASESLNQNYMLVESPKVPIPWASYDTTNVKDIVDLMHATGTTPGDALAYERANQKRQAVIDAIESSETKAPKDAPVVVSA